MSPKPKNHVKGKPAKVSELEETLAGQLRLRGISYEREVELIPGRKFSMDFYIENRTLIVEVDGGTASGGRHVRPEGYEKDCEKQNLAAQQGYLYMKVTARMVNKEQAVEFIENTPKRK